MAILIMVAMFAFSCPDAAAQTEEPLDLNVLAEEEADKYQRLLDLRIGRYSMWIPL